MIAKVVVDVAAKQTDRIFEYHIPVELEKDIKGGNEVGMDTCWFNIRNENVSMYKPTYEIHKLEELKSIL